MKKYKVEIVEQYRQVIEVESTSKAKAIIEAQKEFEKLDSCFIMQPSAVTFEYVEFNVLGK